MLCYVLCFESYQLDSPFRFLRAGVSLTLVFNIFSNFNRFRVEGFFVVNLLLAPKPSENNLCCKQKCEENYFSVVILRLCDSD